MDHVIFILLGCIAYEDWKFGTIWDGWCLGLLMCCRSVDAFLYGLGLGILLKILFRYQKKSIGDGDVVLFACLATAVGGHFFLKILLCSLVMMVLTRREGPYRVGPYILSGYVFCKFLLN